MVVPAGLVIWELVRGRKRHRGKLGGARVVALLISPLPLLVWHAYLRHVFGEWPAQSAPDVFDVPPIGWLRSMRGDAADALEPVGATGQQRGRSADLILEHEITRRQSAQSIADNTRSGGQTSHPS